MIRCLAAIFWYLIATVFNFTAAAAAAAANTFIIFLFGYPATHIQLAEMA